LTLEFDKILQSIYQKQANSSFESLEQRRKDINHTMQSILRRHDQTEGG